MNEGNVHKWCCLFNGGRQTCTMKRDLDAHLSSPRIWKAWLMLMLVKTGDSLFMSFMNFPTFCDLSSTRQSQFNSNTVNFVKDQSQEYSQMNTSRSERNGYRLIKRSGSRLLWQGDSQACATHGQASITMGTTYAISSSGIKIIKMNKVLFCLLQNSSYFKKDLHNLTQISTLHF
jgi:hypothetical protein